LIAVADDANMCSCLRSSAYFCRDSSSPSPSGRARS
jgi:hypothetical protein